MPFKLTSFHQRLKPLDRRQLDRIVARHAGDHAVGRRSGAWTWQRHLKALLFAQLSGLNSLREIERGLDGPINRQKQSNDRCWPEGATRCVVSLQQIAWQKS